MATGDIAAVLAQALRYEPETGLVTWRVSSGCRKPGDVAASVNSLGYGRVKVAGKTFGAHRVAWALHYGSMPALHIDHINGVKTDNRIANLRLATRSQNQMNRGSATGHKGVTWSSAQGRWLARCAVGGRRHHLGYFETLPAAIAAYKRAASQLHGQFFKE